MQIDVTGKVLSTVSSSSKNNNHSVWELNESAAGHHVTLKEIMNIPDDSFTAE
jgi:hypothetical protein